jgi:ATP-binding cassette subfamily B protein RaxB
VTDSDHTHSHKGNLLQFFHGQRLPMVYQSETAECGLACLCMIAQYHGHDLDMNSMRRQELVSMKGLTLKMLMRSAANLALSTRAIKVELNRLNQIKTPAILHWDMNHFVVLKHVNHEAVVIHDPARGIRKLAHKEAGNHFTGVALELQPTTEFKPKKIQQRIRLRDFYHKSQGLRLFLVQFFVFAILLEIFAVATPFHMQLVIDEVLLSQDSDLLLVLGIGFGLLVLFNTVVSALRSLLVIYLSSQLSLQMANNVMTHLLKLPLSYFQSRHIGDVVSRFGSLNTIRELLSTGIIEAIIDGLMVVIALILMAFYSITLTLIMVGVVTLYCLLRVVLYKPLHDVSEEQIVHQAKENSNFMETVRAMQGIKVFGREVHRQAIWQNKYADMINSGIKESKLTILFTALNTFLFGIANVLIISIAAKLVLANAFTVGMVYAFMAYKQHFTTRVAALIDKLIAFKMITIHLQRVGDIALAKPEQQHNYQLHTLSVDESEYQFELKNIHYQYAEEEFVLNNINLAVQSGESIVITGPSGCGKSTLMKIMLGLLKPNSGEVLYNGKPIRHVGLKNYRQVTAAVLQDDYLLSGSIADNISFFDPQPDDMLIARSAKQAAIYNEIMKMPMGFNTLIGDMGTALSGGQIQRILIARALYKKPLILFMDEATSHLDSVLEKRISQTIKNQKITRIFIAHRKETIKVAQKVLLLNKDGLLEIDGLSRNTSSLIF